MQWMMNEQDRFTRPEETVNDFSFNCPPQQHFTCACCEFLRKQVKKSSLYDTST
jgi:hypothetical protein